MSRNFVKIITGAVLTAALLGSFSGETYCQLIWGPTALVNGFSGQKPFAKVKTDPSDPDIVWAATGNFPDPTAASVPPADGFYKSTDGGATWVLVSDSNLITQTNITDFTICPSDPGILYVATNVSGIYKTTDGGLTWAAVNNGITHDGRSFPDSTWGALSVAVDPGDPDIVYCGVANMNNVDVESGSGNHPGFFKSTDGGASWASRNQGLPAMYDPIDIFDLTSHTVAVGSIVIPPQFPSVVVIGLFDIEINAEFLFGKTARSHGRVFFSTNRAEGSWQEKSTGLADISWPSNGNDLARLSLSSVFLSVSEGPQFLIYATHQGGGASVEADDFIWKAQSKGVYKAAGNSWVRRSGGLPQITDENNDNATNAGPVCMSPVNPQLLLVGIGASDSGNPASDNSKVYVSLNGGQNWSKRWDSGLSNSPVMGYTEANPLFLAVSADQSKAYASVLWSGGPEDDGIYRIPPLSPRGCVAAPHVAAPLLDSNGRFVLK